MELDSRTSSHQSPGFTMSLNLHGTPCPGVHSRALGCKPGFWAGSGLCLYPACVLAQVMYHPISSRARCRHFSAQWIPSPPLPPVQPTLNLPCPRFCGLCGHSPMRHGLIGQQPSSNYSTKKNVVLHREVTSRADSKCRRKHCKRHVGMALPGPCASQPALQLRVRTSLEAACPRGRAPQTCKAWTMPNSMLE